jgi:hypothetical protein
LRDKDDKAEVNCLKINAFVAHPISNQQAKTQRHALQVHFMTFVYDTIYALYVLKVLKHRFTNGH